MPTVLLIRHGRTTANVTGTLAGWSPGIGLDEQGEGSVRDLAERLQGLPLTRIVTSPLQRCQETAAILAASLPGAAPVVDDDLGECRYGAWTGRALKELAQEALWRTVQDQPSAARFPDGESFPGESLAAMQLRAVQAVRRHDELVAAEHGQDALWAVVSHGDVIKSIVADAAGAHLDHFQRIMVGPASLSVVRYTDRRPFVIRVNDSGADLGSLVPAPASPEEAGDAAVGGGTP